MKKDFDRWNDKKKTIHEKGHQPFFHEREIWWCTLGVNIGFEQDGSGDVYRRPVLIIRGFNPESCFCVALTGKKREDKYHLYIGVVDGRDASAILSQARLIDTKRLVRKIATLDKSTFALLKTKMSKVLFGEESLKTSLPSLARGRGRSHM